MTGEPGELYELHLERAEIELLAEPVLIIALDGYIDAGSGVQAGRRPPAVQPGTHRRRHLRRRPADRLPGPPAHPDLPVERLHRLPGAGAAGPPAHRHRRHLVPAALRAGAGQPVGAVRRRGRSGRRPVRGAADRRSDGDPDGGPAHPADRDVLARHPQRAAARAGGLAGHHPGPGPRRRAAGVPVRPGRAGHHRVRRARPALHRPLGLPGDRPHADPGHRGRHRAAAAHQRTGRGRRHRAARSWPSRSPRTPRSRTSSRPWSSSTTPTSRRPAAACSPSRRRCRPPTSWAPSSRPSSPTGSAPATDRRDRAPDRGRAESPATSA